MKTSIHQKVSFKISVQLIQGNTSVNIVVPFQNINKTLSISAFPSCTIIGAQESIILVLKEM